LHRGQGLCVQLYAWLQRVQVLRYLGSLSGGGSALAARICFPFAALFGGLMLGLSLVGFGGESILEGARFYGNYG